MEKMAEQTHLPSTTDRKFVDTVSVPTLQAMWEDNPCHLFQREKSTGCTLVHVAASANRKDIISFVRGIDSDILAEETNDGETPCFFAAKEGSFEALMALQLIVPATMFSSTHDGRRPIDVARGKCKDFLFQLYKTTDTEIGALSQGEAPGGHTRYIDEVGRPSNTGRASDSTATATKRDERRSLAPVAHTFTEDKTTKVRYGNRKWHSQEDIDKWRADLMGQLKSRGLTESYDDSASSCSSASTIANSSRQSWTSSTSPPRKSVLLKGLRKSLSKLVPDGWKKKSSSTSWSSSDTNDFVSG